jgi:hypothetical protein
MQKFEYLVLLFETDRDPEALAKLSADLTKKGKEGWDLVSVVAAKDIRKNGSYFHFKRLISN